MGDAINVGAVAYDAKVVPIWEGIRDYFRQRGIETDYVLFSNYDALVDALLSRTVDVAWNTNLAYVKVHRRTSGKCRALASGIRTSVSPQKSSREPGAASRGSKI